MLTGHTKKLFEEWYNKKYDDFIFSLVGEHTFNPAVEFFDTMPLNHQSGVYLEFLREQGYDVVIGYAYEFTEKPQYFYQISNGVERKSDCKTYPEYNTALTQAIQKCNELINGEQK